MNEQQTWVIIAAISDINYCLKSNTTKKNITHTLKKTRDMLKNINLYPVVDPQNMEADLKKAVKLKDEIRQLEWRIGQYEAYVNKTAHDLTRINRGGIGDELLR